MLVASLTCLSIAVVAGSAVKPALALIALAFVAANWRTLLGWRTLIVTLILVIMFIPIRRYALPGDLPFQVEPYRLLIAFVAAMWLMSLLVDSRVRLTRTMLDRPMLAVFAASAASIVVNLPRIEADRVSSEAIKQLTFLASFITLFFLLTSLIRRLEDVDALLRVLVGGGGVVALFALVEVRTGFNPFNQLDRVLPFLSQTGDVVSLSRGGYARVVGSSQHPIALGAMFVLLVPISLYLGRRQKLWYGVTLLLAVGTLATGSRTGVVMLVACGATSLALRPRETARFWPALLPMLVIIHFAIPGALGGFYKSFFPEGGLIAEQADAQVGSSRVTSLGPGLHQVGLNPLLGNGFGARVFHGDNANSFIVDDQWLSTAMEVGLIGFAAWVWLFVSFLRRIFRAARRHADDLGWLLTGIASSVTAFAVGMLTYDAFSFIQTTLVLFLLLGFGCTVVSASERVAEG